MLHMTSLSDLGLTHCLGGFLPWCNIPVDPVVSHTNWMAALLLAILIVMFRYLRYEVQSRMAVCKYPMSMTLHSLAVAFMPRIERWRPR